MSGAESQLRSTRRRDLALLIAPLAAANSISAAFATFYLLERYIQPWHAAAMALLTFAGALAGAWLLGRTALGGWSLRNRIFCGLACLLIHYDFLASIDTFPIPCAFGAAFTFGLFIAIFFIPWNGAVLSLTSDGDRGTVIGGYGLILPLSATIGPLAGAWLIVNVSFVAAVVVSMAIIGATAAFALARARLPEGRAARLDRRIFAAFTRRAAAGLFSEGLFEGSVGTAQPVLAVLYLHGEREYGNLLFLFSLGGAAAALALARVSDRVRNRVAFLRIGLAVLIPASLIGLVWNAYFGFTVSLALVSIGLPIAALFLYALASDSGEGRQFDVAMWREILLNSGRMCGAAVVLFAIIAFAVPQVAFVVMLVAAVGMSLARVGSSFKSEPPQVGPTGTS